MKSLIYALPFFLFLGSCLSKKDPTSWEQLPVSENHSDQLFKLGKRLVFPLDSLSSSNSDFYDLIQIDGREYLGVKNYNVNSIDLYEISTSSLSKRIMLTEEGDKGVGRIGSFTWINSDSIIIISIPNSGNRISMVNESGELISTIAKTVFEKGEFMLFGETANKPIFFHQQLYLTRMYILGGIDPVRNYANENRNMEMVIDLQDRKRYDIPTPFPESKRIAGVQGMRSRGHDNQLIYSFASDHYLYTQDMDKREGVMEYKSKHLAKSKFLGNFEPFFYDPETVYDWNLKHGEYFGVFWDPYRAVYYRIVELPTTEKMTPEGKMWDLAHQMPFSIIVLDKDFNILGEQLLPRSTYNLHRSAQVFVHPDGLYIGLNNPFNKDIEEDELVFQLFELKSSVTSQALGVRNKS